MPTHDPDRLEALLADALAAHDEQGQAGLDAFLREHAADRTALERGLARCRQLGLLGEPAPTRDFPDRLGEFRLVRRLGSGGMGVVYEAEQESLGRRVALKVVRPELLYFEGARERFRREIEAVARLSHPSVVPVLASGDQDGVPWYAMELLKGRTMHEVCLALAGRDPATLRGEDLRGAIGPAMESGTDPLHGPWWQVCARITLAVALGVRHAHLRGIVHRDIKPSNVMLTTDGRTVLLDFGVALLGGGREFTRTGATPGSPAFMSPEQLRGDAVDERTDVYSLGATLWQMLTLVPPFRGDSDLQRIRDGEVPSVTAHNREVPRELVVVLQKAMDRDRERRYADVQQFADDLSAVLQRRPIAARRLGWSLRSWRWCQRHRVTATALASLLVVALLLPALIAWRERNVSKVLAAAAEVSDQSVTMLLQALQSQLVRVADEKLRHVPEASAVARASLQDALAIYRQLLVQHPANERLRGNTVDAITRLADLLARHGEPAQACSLLQEALALLGGDDPARPDGERYKRALVHAHLAGHFVQEGDLATADGHFAAAGRDLAAVAAVRGDNLDVRRMRLELLRLQAGALEPQLARERVEALAAEAIELARGVCRERPDNAADARQLVELLDLLGTVRLKNDRFDEAVPVLEEALQLARAIPADATIWPPPSHVLSDVLMTLGNAHIGRRDLAGVPLLKECLQLREREVQDHPSDVLLRSDLGAVLHSLASLNFQQEQDELALERLDRAIALQRSVVAAMPALAQGREYLRNHLTLRGSTLARLGRAADLHDVVTELAGMATDAAAQRTAARLWLRLARLRAGEAVDATSLPEPAACHDRAMACLLRAEQLGWGPRNPLAETLYEPLRARPEFQQLAERVAARVGPPRTRPR